MMNLFSEGIAERAVGQYPLSIATSLALEGLAGIYEDRPESPPPILKYDQVWVNLRTLFRNFIGSLEKSLQEMMDPVEAAETVSEEMERLTDIVRDLNPNCGVHFFVSNFDGMERAYPRAVIRMDKTAKQKAYTIMQTHAIEALLHKHKGDANLSVFSRKLEFNKTPSPSVAILTHFAYDLLSAKLFKRMDLIESHTGVIKPRALWYTKFHDGKELVMIPFREDMLQIFGDKETFHPLDIKVRKELIEVAKHYNWSQVTTTDRIRYSIDAMKNHYAVDILKEIITSQ
jgi:hypothetical protein